MTLSQRAQTFIKELGVPVLTFCRKVGISSTTYYDWLKGKALADTTLERIDTYLSKYNF